MLSPTLVSLQLLDITSLQSLFLFSSWTLLPSNPCSSSAPGQYFPSAPGQYFPPTLVSLQLLDNTSPQPLFLFSSWTILPSSPCFSSAPGQYFPPALVSLQLLDNTSANSMSLLVMAMVKSQNNNYHEFFEGKNHILPRVNSLLHTSQTSFH
jgi:hypothetical protein